MKIAQWGLMALLAALPVRAEEEEPEPELTPSEQVWDAATRYLRKEPLGDGSAAVRRLTIDAAGRRNVFFVSFQKKEMPPKGAKGKGAQGKKPEINPEIPDDLAGPVLSAWNQAYGLAEDDFTRGRENRAYESLEKLSQEADKAVFASQENNVKRLKVIEQCAKLRGRIEIRREFRKRGHQVNFIIFKPEDSQRSVVSVDGEIARQGGMFGGGVTVRAIGKSRVTVDYKGETFELSLVKAQ